MDELLKLAFKAGMQKGMKDFGLEQPVKKEVSYAPPNAGLGYTPPNMAWGAIPETGYGKKNPVMTRSVK